MSRVSWGGVRAGVGAFGAATMVLCGRSKPSIWGHCVSLIKSGSLMVYGLEGLRVWRSDFGVVKREPRNVVYPRELLDLRTSFVFVK